MNEKSKQRVDADNAFLRMQNRSSVQARIMSETEEADMARDANTARLKALRLEKAALELAIPATKPGKR